MSTLSDDRVYFVDAAMLGSVIEAKAHLLGAGAETLKRKRQLKFRELARILTMLKLVPFTFEEIKIISFGCNNLGESGLLVTAAGSTALREK